MVGWAVTSAAARSEPAVTQPVRSFVELRVGADAHVNASDNVWPPRPYLCGELVPLARLSIEACGNGAGVIHQADVADFAHFRVRGSLYSSMVEDNLVDILLGAGFAEVQRAADQPGFRFGQADAGAVEAAGPEGSVSVKVRRDVGARLVGSLDANVGAAWIPGAPEVVGALTQDPVGPVIPFVSVTAGVGF